MNPCCGPARLLLDDGSTDKTADICREMASNDPRCTIITKVNSGLVDTLNLGIMRARAPVIARMDGDDISFAHRLEEQLSALTFGQCAALSSGYLHIDEFGNEIGHSTPTELAEADADMTPPREPYLMHPFLMIRKDVLLQAGGYRHCLHSEDVDLYWRLFEDVPLMNLPYVHGRYRLHTKSVSSRSAANARVQAVSAMLAAISHTRRRSGYEDIAFNHSLADVRPASESIRSLCDLYRDQLSPQELARVELGASLRFLDFSRFRKYEVTLDDLQYAREMSRRHRKLYREGVEQWGNWVIVEAFKQLLS